MFSGSMKDWAHQRDDRKTFCIQRIRSHRPGGSTKTVALPLVQEGAMLARSLDLRLRGV